MREATLAERALAAPGDLEPLPDYLTVAELAQLRASTAGALDHVLHGALVQRMESQVRMKRLVLVDRPYEAWTGAYIGTREVDRYRRSPLDPVVTEEYRYEAPTGGPADAGDRKEMRAHERLCVHRDAARDLYAHDPCSWSEASRAWAGIAGQAAEQPSSRTADHATTKAPRITKRQCPIGDRPAKQDEIIKELIGPKHGFKENDVISRFNNVNRNPWLEACRLDRGLYAFDMTIRAFEAHSSLERPNRKRSEGWSGNGA